MDYMGIVLLVIFAAFIYLMIIRPQQKRMREQMELMRGLRVGDEVMTSSGIFGTIAELEEDTVLLEVAEEVLVRMAKSAVTRVFTEHEEPEEEVEEEPEGLEEEEEAEGAGEGESEGEEPEDVAEAEEEAEAAPEAGEEAGKSAGGGEPGKPGRASEGGKKRKKR